MNVRFLFIHKICVKLIPFSRKASIQKVLYERQKWATLSKGLSVLITESGPKAWLFAECLNVKLTLTVWPKCQQMLLSSNSCKAGCSQFRLCP